MKLEFAFLADAATILNDGLFDVIGGGFDVVLGKAFPATKHAMVLIGRIQFSPEECGKEFELLGEIVDHDGNGIFPELRGTVTARPHPRNPKRTNWMTVCLNCQAVTFPVPGEYFFRLSVDKQFLGQVGIEVVAEENPI